jgi:hypothetical protein
MAIAANTRLKAELLKAVIDQVTGGNCILQERENSIKIVLSEQQKEWFKKFLNTQLDMRRKPDIEIDALGIILPVVLKKVWPFLLGGGALIASAFARGRGDGGSEIEDENDE